MPLPIEASGFRRPCPKIAMNSSRCSPVCVRAATKASISLRASLPAVGIGQFPLVLASARGLKEGHPSFRDPAPGIGRLPGIRKNGQPFAIFADEIERNRVKEALHSQQR